MQKSFGHMMIQVDSAEFPNELIDIEIPLEFSRSNCLVRCGNEQLSPLLFKQKQSLPYGIGFGNIVEFEETCRHRTTAAQPCFAGPAKPTVDKSPEPVQSRRQVHGRVNEAS